MEYRKVSQTARDWGISERRVRTLCEEGKIDGVERNGHRYLIPVNAVRPIDRRTRKGKSISSEALAILDRIDLKKAEMDRQRPLPTGEYNQMSKDFLIVTTYHSCALSGNSFTKSETAALISGSVIPGKPLKEHLEIAGHRDAFLYIQGLSQSQLKLTERTIKDIHSLLMIDRPRDKGTYRHSMSAIHGSRHELTLPHMINSQMEELLAEFPKTSLHPIENAVRFHLKFEMIHPFSDGNGRVGRLLLNLLLLNHGYPAVAIRLQDRDRYNQAFAAYLENETAIPLLNLVGERMEERINSCIAKRRPAVSTSPN